MGKEIPYPNTMEHFIMSIRLYFKLENGKFITDLGEAIFTTRGESIGGPNEAPAYTAYAPVALFKVKLDKPGKLYAWSYCNIHGLWENSLEAKL